MVNTRASTTSNQVTELTDLKARHGALERRLAEIDRHVALTSDEQVERSRLKKEKLLLKDRMAALGHVA